MSPSEPALSEASVTSAGRRFADAVENAAAVAENMAERGEATPETALRQLVTLAVRLYAAAVERTGDEPAPTDGTVSTTEAVVTAVALLRAQDLNAFDTALWFSRTAPRG